MKIFSTLSPLALLVLAGCGGVDSFLSRHSGPGDERGTPEVSTTVSRSTVAAGGTAIAQVSQTGYGADVTYALAVREGDAGGTLTVPDFDGTVSGTNRIYTAPANPGTYHIVGTVTEKGGKTHTKTTTVTVEAAPQG